MKGHIPDTFIDELLTRIDIVDIIQGRIELKSAGGNFVARCPFHAEKTPSFSVSKTKQFYHCFGCGAHGNALKFLTEYDGLHFVDAVEYLANRLGITVPRTSDDDYDKSKQNTEIYTTLAGASDFYHKELLQGAQREKAIQYLKNRGINKHTILDFQLGYAPHGWDNLFKAQTKGQDKDLRIIDLLLDAGLIITKENKPYFDRFRDRIMFPIRNRRGQVVGFGGRILHEGNPKYLNSPETKVFNKSSELYGLYEAKTTLKKLQVLVVVEGYLDVLTLAQFGIKNTVAALGTALTEKHLEILFREVSEVVFCFDGDRAGREAAQRVLLLCLPLMNEGRRIRFMILPEKEDPDSYMRKQGRDAFEKGLHQAKNFSDFLFESFLVNIDLNQVEGRAEYIRRLRPLIAKVPQGVLQHMLYERLGELARISIDRIEQSVLQTPRGNFKPDRQSDDRTYSSGMSRRMRPNPSKNQGPCPPAYKAAALLLANPSFIRYIKTPHGLEQGDSPGAPLLCAIIEILLKDPNLSSEMLLGKVKILEGLGKEISYIANFNDMIEWMPSEGRDAEFIGAVDRLKERVFDITLEALLMKSKVDPLTSQEKIELKEMLKQKEQGWVDS